MSRAGAAAGPTESTYYAASIENALLDRQAIERRIADALAEGEASNDLIRRASVSVNLVTSRP